MKNPSVFDNFLSLDRLEFSGNRRKHPDIYLEILFSLIGALTGGFDATTSCIWLVGKDVKCKGALVTVLPRKSEEPAFSPLPEFLLRV